MTLSLQQRGNHPVWIDERAGSIHNSRGSVPIIDYYCYAERFALLQSERYNLATCVEGTGVPIE